MLAVRRSHPLATRYTNSDDRHARSDDPSPTSAPVSLPWLIPNISLSLVVFLLVRVDFDVRFLLFSVALRPVFDFGSMVDGV